MLFLVWLFIFFAVAGAAFLLSRVPLPAAQVQTQTTFIYAADGKTQLAAINSGENRVAVHLNQVPPVAIDAVLASEDHNYYQHGGVDPIGVLRAFVSDLRGNGSLQGGSTITQQYIKQAYLGSQRTLVRKAKEAALAIRLQRKLSKDQILERYLNTIYWGRGAYGIQAASQAYFQENVEQLTLPQAALLAGMIRGPELADPVRSPAVAEGRRAEALASMVRYHKITQVQADDAKATPLPAAVAATGQQQSTILLEKHHAQYFLDYVQQQLQQRYQLGLGLRVTTTIDLNMQDQAYTAIYGRAGLAYSGDPAGALVAVDNNGFVKAMVGGKDYATSQVNLAVGKAGGGSGRQPGSTFKPFLLAETIKEGYSVRSTFPGPPTVVLKGQGDNGADYPVNNFQSEDGGPSTNLIDATAHSINTVYAQLEMAIGTDKLLAMAKQLGLDPSDVGLARNPSLVLGTAQVSVLEMAAAYSTFSRGGTFLAPQVITKVTTSDGTVLPWGAPTPKPILTKAQNDILNYCLQQVVLKGTGVAANFDTAIAGKTGTTSDFTDAWFIGYTPKLTAAVWMGYRDGSKSMTNIGGTAGGAQGGGVPASLWRHFMTAVTANGSNGSYTGTFNPVTTFPGTLIGSPSNLVSFPKGTGTATTTIPATPLTPTPGAPRNTVPSGPPTTAPRGRSTTTLPQSTTTLPNTSTTTKARTTTTTKPPH
ncbi:MAG: penicillin-binding protein [Acidimicrobiaceae bacterium]|nr:penicillin-binding protein [Acidimicrobiaceae bacterium]